MKQLQMGVGPDFEAERASRDPVIRGMEGLIQCHFVL